MIVLLDTSQDLDQCGAELGLPVGQLLTPLTRFTLRNPAAPWAIDNGAFAGFERASFCSLLEREKDHQETCLFVAMPDVVGSARRTIEAFYRWYLRPELRGWKRALVCQDGQEDQYLPWDDIDAIFIGGTDRFKCSDGVKQLIQCAQILGKWVHVGRVNDPARFAWCEELGVDSVDGTGISRYSHMREAIAKRHNQEKLWAS